jgi:hypothetical protein
MTMGDLPTVQQKHDMFTGGVCFMQQLSDDGKWMWNGTEWVPYEAPDENPEPAAVDAPAEAEPSVAQEPVQDMPAMVQNPTLTDGAWAIQTAEYGLFFTKLLGFLLKIITLGFGLPWAKCMVINKWSKNVRIDGRRIQFTGTPMGLFGIWVKICVLSIITLTLYYWFAGYKQVAKYIDSHITWA